MRPLVVIVGPTAVGKSTLGLDLAQAIEGEIISGDSVQVYRMLDIGSAKTPLKERRGIPHHLMDFLDPTEPFSVALFRESAFLFIQEIRRRRRAPIMVGGTGLYVRSILDPYSFYESGSEKLRQEWQDYLLHNGKECLHEALKIRDPVSAAHLHPNDIMRIIRALEVYELTGHTLSSQKEFNDSDYAPLDSTIVYIGLTAPREFIYEKINSRCEEMLEQGLVEETLELLKRGYSWRIKPLQSIGYRHVVWYLRGLVTRWEMLRLMQRDTRHFAKRQLTWFRRDPRITWYDITRLSREEILAQVIKTCGGRETRVK
ncbi:MAG: tRNA (adenosine(37)-N6)-dimethylallyltransferase MiaA [Desulfitobacteriaceae bacterium]